MPRTGPIRWIVVITVALVVFYSVLVLGLAATSPDIGIRCLLANRSRLASNPFGVEIQKLDNLIAAEGCESPQCGDYLLWVGEVRTYTFSDFAKALGELRGSHVLPGGQLDPGTDVSEKMALIPPLVMVEGQRWVKIEFLRPGWKETKKSFVWVHALPVSELLLSLTWFLCASGILLLSALAVWHRPLDRPTRQFFALCAVTLAAYMGGFHWWVIADHTWLTVPFVMTGTLLPFVSLHFFLIYPRPAPPIEQHPRTILGLLYALPGLAMLGMIAVLFDLRWLQSDAPSVAVAARMLGGLQILRGEIYGYLVCAGLCFLMLLGVLAYRLSTAQLPVEHSQMKWIFWAGLIAAIPIGYTLYLAFSFHPDDRVRFAFGWESRLSMFFASLCFMLAYGVGIVRFQWMLMDQMVSKGMVYYLASSGITFAFALTVAVLALLTGARNLTLASQQSLFLALILALVIVILLWLRDRFQQTVDRRFYREKYQLDKAFQRINQAIGHFADRQSLAQRMIGSCRDVLRVDGMALYVCESDAGQFQLLAAEGEFAGPREFSAEKELLEAFQQEGTVHRAPPGIRNASSIQFTLRELGAELLHALEIRGQVVGVVALGRKSNGIAYTAEDLTFLSALGQITSVALHSEEIHRNLTRLNEELQLKAQKIGEQKRRIAMMQAELTSGNGFVPQRTPDQFHRDLIKGDSPAIQRVLETARKVALSEASVLIRGESGTGKEILAQVIHENSPRKSGPLVRVHCAALSPSLLESELFGHVKGAFTGAHRDRMGRFEMANGGTLFLDEIGDISLETQVKLLRVLQTHSFEPVGSTRTIEVDVRLTTATHQDLRRLIENGRFREDLYYRLNVITLELPPLRERGEDVFELALYFLQKASRRTGKQISDLEEDALEALRRYAWPGNVRELENAIERAVVLAEQSSITLAELPEEIVAATTEFSNSVPRRAAVTSRNRSVGQPVEVSQSSQFAVPGRWDMASERDVLANALEQCSGNKAQAARLLGMPRSTYYSKLKKYRIKPR